MKRPKYERGYDSILARPSRDYQYLPTRVKTCRKCGAEFATTCPCAKYCPDCSPRARYTGRGTAISSVRTPLSASDGTPATVDTRKTSGGGK